MSKYSVTSGVQTAPVKVVLYGPEGIGKSSFAAKFPQPVFIDTEGGTKRLNVARLPAPTSWAMLLDEVAEVRKGNVPAARWSSTRQTGPSAFAPRPSAPGPRYTA